MSGAAGASLILGTVQFGLAYGVAGRGEAVPEREVREILELAADNGVTTLDTAPAYGDIEERLGDLCSGLSLNVISKIPPAPEEGVEGAIREAVDRSRRRLGSRLTTLLFHRAEDLLGPDGDVIWHSATSAGDDLRIGASCYDPETAVQLRERYGMRVVQLPANPLDQRLADAGIAEGLEDVEVHARSPFLQGLLLMPTEAAARKVPASAEAHAEWTRWCEENEMSPVAAALSITRGLPRVRACVVGVDSAAQFRDVLESARQAEPVAAPSLRCDDPKVIDPRRWKAA